MMKVLKVFILFLVFFYLFQVKPVFAQSLPTNRLYTGQIKDDTGLYYYNARYYDPYLGIFTSADRAQGPNRYSYVGGNPIMRNDPTGNFVPVSSRMVNMLSGEYPSAPQPITNISDALRAASGYLEFIVPDFLIPDAWGGKKYISKSNAMELQLGSAMMGMVGTIQASSEVSKMTRADTTLFFSGKEIVKKVVNSDSPEYVKQNMQLEIEQMRKYGNGELLPKFQGTVEGGYEMGQVRGVDLWKYEGEIPRSVYLDARRKLQDLHSQGFIHGDLAGGCNIMVSCDSLGEANKIWLIDPGNPVGTVARDLSAFDSQLISRLGRD